jgi:hypothetical protein
MEFGNAAELQAFDNFVTDEVGGVFQSFDGAFLFGLGAACAYQDPGVAHILRDEDLIDDDGNFQARVLEFAGEHGVDFVGDFFADTFVTMIDGGHGCLRGGEDINIMNCFLAQWKCRRKGALEHSEPG